MCSNTRIPERSSRVSCAPSLTGQMDPEVSLLNTRSWGKYRPALWCPGISVEHLSAPGYQERGREEEQGGDQIEEDGNIGKEKCRDHSDRLKHKYAAAFPD